MLDTILDRLNRSLRLRLLLFFVVSIVALLCSGYVWGTHDQAIHIPFLKSFADPTLYPGDDFIMARDVHFSYFWLAFIPFYRAGILEPVMFAVHFLTLFFTFWSFWELSQLLFKNTLAALITTAAVTFPHLAFPGFLIFEVQLLNRSFVLPIAIFCIVLYLKKKVIPAFLILGLAANLHLLTVYYAMALIMLDMVIRIKTIGWKTAIIAVILFFAGSLPVMIWRYNLHIPMDLSLRPDWLAFEKSLYLGLLFDFLNFRNPLVLLDAICLVGTFGLFLTARRATTGTEYGKSIDHFFYAIVLVLIASTVVSYLLPATFIVSLQISRTTVFFLYIAILVYSYWLARQLQEGKLGKLDFGILAFVFTTYVSMLLPFLFLAARKWFANNRRRQYVMIAVLVVFHLGTMGIGVAANIWPKGIHIYVQQTPWVATQNWARLNTPKTARFITPPQVTDFYIPDWRVFSERSTFVTLPESMEGILNVDFAQDWISRFDRLVPGARARLNGWWPDNTRVIAEAYASRSAEDMLTLAKETKSEYLVVEKPHKYNFPVAYENQDYIVYNLSSLINK
jgi:hypothetical protein